MRRLVSAYLGFVRLFFPYQGGPSSRTQRLPDRYRADQTSSKINRCYVHHHEEAGLSVIWNLTYSAARYKNGYYLSNPAIVDRTWLFTISRLTSNIIQHATRHLPRFV